MYKLSHRRSDCLSITILLAVICLVLSALLAVSSSAIAQTDTKKPAILFLSGQFLPSVAHELDPRVEKEIKDLGFQVAWCTNFDQLTPEYLRQFNAVVTYMFPKTDTSTVRQQMDILRQYVEEGGGLFLTGQIEQEPGVFGIRAQNMIIEPMGAEILHEQVHDDSNMHFCPNFSYEFCWTDRITKDPLTESVTALWYPAKGSCVGSVWTSAIKADNNWKVLVTGMSSSRSWRVDKQDNHFIAEDATYTSNPPIIAVREYGKGRVVLFPIHHAFTFVDGYHSYQLEGGIVMDSNIDGKRSHGAKLTYNLLKWVAEPSIKNGTPGGYAPAPPAQRQEPRNSGGNPPSRQQQPMDIPFKNAYLGLVGAQTSLSSGKGTPEEFIASAKKAGYKFTVFTEDLATLTPQEWDQLAEVCKKNTDESFRAVPGLYFVDSLDCAMVTFGEIGYPPDDWREPTDPQHRIKWANCFARGYTRTPPICVINPHKNNLPLRLTANIYGVSLYTYEGKKLVDNAVNDYIMGQAEGMVMFPLAVHFVRTPKEVEEARNIGFQTYIRANSLAQIIEQIDDMAWARMKVYKPSFVSEGPEIEQVYSPDWGADLAVPSNDLMRVWLAARSDVGLTKVELLDYGKVVRRFFPKGKEFRLEFDDYHDRQHDYILKVTDKNGKVAYSWDRRTECYECWQRNCSDNWNDLGWGKWNGEKIHAVRGIESYLPSRSDGDMRILSFGKYPAIIGHAPGKAPEKTGGQLSMKESKLVSRFGCILDYSIGNVAADGNDDIPGVASGHKIIHNPNISGGIRDYFFCGRGGGIDLRIIEGKIKAYRDIETDSAFPIRFFNSTNKSGNGRLDNYAVSNGFGKAGIIQPATGDAVKKWEYKAEVKPGGYASIFPDLTAVFPLEDGYSIYTSRTPETANTATTTMFLGPTNQPKLIKAGTEYKFRYALLIGVRGVGPTNKEAEEVRTKMGFAGPAAYKVTPKIGTVEDTKLVLSLKAENYGWQGKVTQAHLPIALPVYIDGLNERWSAGIWYKGTNKQLIPDYSVDDESRTWETRTDDLQRFSFLNGMGFLQMDIEGGDRDVFIGNLVVCEDPNIWLTLVTKPDKLYVVAHNPTNRPVTIHVRPAPGFTLLGSFNKEVTIPAGSSVEAGIK